MALGGSVLLLLGSFMPIAVAHGWLGTSKSFTLWEGDAAGLVALGIIGMLAYHAIYFSRSRAIDRKIWARAGILVDVVAVMLVFGAFGAVEDEISDVSSEVPVSGSSGIGVMIAGFVIVIIGSIVASAASNTPRPKPLPQVSPGPPPPPTVTVLLRELDMLRQHGKVTDEEYAARRKRILES
jgi:hypothetical protein